MSPRISQETVQMECEDCEGTGIYRGCFEPEGTGVVCRACDGSGRQTMTYTPFISRKLREDVRKVRHPSYDAEVGSGEISYQQFLAGERPK